MSDNKKYTPTTLPRKIKTTIYTHYCISGYNAGEIRNYDFNAMGQEYLLLTTTDIEIRIPKQADIKSKVIEALEEEKKKIQAESFKKLKEIQDKIDSLLVIEYKPDDFKDIELTSNEIPF